MKLPAFNRKKNSHMAEKKRVCPIWVGYTFLLNPLRKILENPKAMLEPYVKPGMTVLETGCALGFFTLPLARMVGPSGKVVAVDVQQNMLDGLARRASRAGLSDRLELRLASDNSQNLADLGRTVDFVCALHMVHEVPSAESFFQEVGEVTKTGAKLLFIEPKGHVSKERFLQCIGFAEDAGFKFLADSSNPAKSRALFQKS